VRDVGEFFGAAADAGATFLLLYACSAERAPRRVDLSTEREVTSPLDPRGASTGDPTNQSTPSEASVAAHRQEIKSRLSIAPDEQTRRQLLAELEKYPPLPSSSSRVIGQNSLGERATMEDALRWWPYRPVYSSVTGLRRAKTQTIIVSSEAGGRRGSAAWYGSQLAIFYTVRSDDIDTSDIYRLVNKGGVSISVQRLSPERYQAIEDRTAKVPPTGRAVVVRGRPGRLNDITRSSGSNVDIRNVEWTEPLPDGSVLWLSVKNSPLIYSDDETVAWIEELSESRL